MIRGAVYGSIGLMVGATWQGLVAPHLWLLIVPFLWALSFLLTFPILMSVAIPIEYVLRLLFRRVRGGWFYFSSFLAALPFVAAMLAALAAAWSVDDSFRYCENPGVALGVARAIVGTSLGLGLGCAQEIVEDTIPFNGRSHEVRP